VRPEPHLLYIEDDPVNIRLVQQIFRSHGGAVVESATHGRSGIERAQRDQPDLILLDMVLPDMTGEEVTAALKADAVTREIPIVILSGASDAAVRNGALEAGASGYLGKPFKIADLLALVDRFVRTP
jgi:CheY-like chemotaxis protein